MSDEEESGTMTIDITTTSTLNALFERVEETGIFNILESVTFDTRSQAFILHLQQLLGERTEKINRKDLVDDYQAHGKIERLSEMYKLKYPELLNCFKEWKFLRQKLLQLLGSYSNDLARNSSIVSGFRIFTSAADILGIFMRHKGVPNESVINVLMENASFCGLMATFIEMVMTKKMFADVEVALKKDHKAFEKIMQWFKKTEELDVSIRSFFPYDIEKDLVMKLQACSDDLDDSQKIFVAVVASNVKQNTKLFKNKDFLYAAERFAASEAGKFWFHNVLLESDHYWVESSNSTLFGEKRALHNVFPIQKHLYMDISRMLARTDRMKIILNTLTVFSAGSNLLLGEKTDESNVLENLLKIFVEELDKIQTIVHSLNPLRISAT